MTLRQLWHTLWARNPHTQHFLKYTRDEENAIDKLFWRDGISRNDYKAFGRVIVFDTTYKVNAYNKPLVVIAGLNHQSPQEDHSICSCFEHKFGC